MPNTSVRSKPIGRAKRVSKKSQDAMLFRFRDQDTAFGVTRKTTHELAVQLGMSETQVLHVALAKMARDYLPAYEPDDGPLTSRQLAAIRKIVPQGKMKVTVSLL
jgi:hypothetical protein